MAELSIHSIHQKYQPKIAGKLRMKIVAHLMGVNAISVRETGDHPNEKESTPKIRLQAMRDMISLGRTGKLRSYLFLCLVLLLSIRS